MCPNNCSPHGGEILDEHAHRGREPKRQTEAGGMRLGEVPTPEPVPPHAPGTPPGSPTPVPPEDDRPPAPPIKLPGVPHAPERVAPADLIPA